MTKALFFPPKVSEGFPWERTAASSTSPWCCATIWIRVSVTYRLLEGGGQDLNWKALCRIKLQDVPAPTRSPGVIMMEAVYSPPN